MWNEAERMDDVVCLKGPSLAWNQKPSIPYDPSDLGQVLCFSSSEKIGSNDMSPSLRRQIASWFRQNTLWGILSFLI